VKHGSLFTGIGGFDLAAEWMGWENVFQCEIDHEKRIDLERNFPKSNQHDDITATDFTVYRDRIDVLTGGFPCQDASLAKQDGEGQQGLQGSRTGLFFEFVRAIEETRPRFIVAENVSNILKTNGGQDFTRILTELARMGYNAEWRVCRASEVGAPHHRSRLYLVAYANSIRLQTGETFFSYVSEKVASFTWRPFGATIQISGGGAWNTEPPILCVDDGLPTKLARKAIHGYGNAIVPQVAFQIFKAIQKHKPQ